jgi:peptidoglycan hydrolase-like protein with peptidoglycan-binding domain
LSGLGQLRWRIVALAAVIAAVLGGGAWFAASGASAPQHGSSSKDSTAQSKDPAAQSKTAHARQAAAKPITVVSLTPASQSQGVNGADSIRVVFSAPLAAASPMPTVSPPIAGNWQRVSPDTLEFVPAQGFPELTRVRVVIPAGATGVRSAAGGLLAATVVDKFWTGSYSTMRAEQLLAQLGYLPLIWAPIAGDLPVPATEANAQLGAAYDPPAGSFTWQSGYPSELMGMWQSGQANEILTGAVMAFESDHGLTMDGIAGPQVWGALLAAVAKGDDNTNGYTYALASQASPETLTVWHDGKVIMRTLANTGIPAAPTTVGTAPVYLKYSFQIMKGTNPDGTKYADPVSWVSYFRSGEAVHYFPRGSYGFQQSLGCVELPYDQAHFIWPYMTYGTLVTVTAP